MAGTFTHNGNVVEGLPSIASQINYSNTSSGMQATQVQAAIDELNTNKQPKTDNNLTTTSKETTGAINELKSGIKGKVYNTRTVSIPADNWCCGIFCCNINGVGDIAGYFMFQNGVLMGADALIKAVDNMLNITYSNGNIIFEPNAEWATIRSLAIMLS